jgi:hypothetical protein
VALMSMPSGSSSDNAEKYYQYLLAHHQNDGRSATWSVDWVSLAWMWGFVAALSLTLVWWIWQYRTTKSRTALYPVDRWGDFVTEMASPASLFFVILSLGLTAFAVVLIAGHLISGQIF